MPWTFKHDEHDGHDEMERCGYGCGGGDGTNTGTDRSHWGRGSRRGFRGSPGLGAGIIGECLRSVRVAHPGEIRGQIAISLRPQDRMPVVGHEAEGKYLHRCMLLARYEQFGERQVIARLAEDPQAPVAAVEHMIESAANSGTSSSCRSAKSYPITAAISKQRWMSPFRVPKIPDVSRKVRRLG